MYPRNRNLLDNPPPADWDICHKNGETLYRCPAFIKYKGTGEVRRCTICKKKSKWEEHLKGQHKFNISEIEDDPMMINKTRERIEKKRSSQDNETYEKLMNSVATIAGQADIPISKITSAQFKNFIREVLDIGVMISKKYKDSIPDLNQYTKYITEKRINPRMEFISEEEFRKRLKKFQKKIFINVLCDAGTVLGFKCVHAMLAHPGVDDSLPFEIYENHEFNGNDYFVFFSDILEKINQYKLYVASIIIDNLPAQMFGISKLIEISDSPFLKSIIIIPCLCHLTNLVFTTAVKKSSLIRKIINEIQCFVVQIRKPEAVKYLKLKCPKFISTRWLYIIDCLKFIFDYSDALYAGRKNGYNIPKIPMSFTYIYEIIIPIKIINLIAERRNSRLFNFFQHYLFAIQNFLKLYEKYKDNNCALEILNEITIQFYARIKTWSCFPVMITAYLCTPEGKQHAKIIIRERMINPNKDIVLNVPDEIIFEPSYNDIKSKFDDSGLYEKIKSLQNLYEENYEESEKENFINIVQKRKVLVQKKLRDYFDESDDEI